MAGKSMIDGVSERHQLRLEYELTDMSNSGGRASSRAQGEMTFNVTCGRSASAVGIGDLAMQVA